MYDYIIATDEGGKIEMDDPDVEASEEQAELEVEVEDEEEANDAEEDDCESCIISPAAFDL